MEKKHQRYVAYTGLLGLILFIYGFPFLFLAIALIIGATIMYFHYAEYFGSVDPTQIIRDDFKEYVLGLKKRDI